jgi:hypothetical protein
MGRRIAMYLAWDRIAETGASLGELDNRFPALFEVRRLFWPGYETLAHAPGGQGIDGFLKTIFLQNFARFGEEVRYALVARAALYSVATTTGLTLRRGFAIPADGF